MSFSVLGHNLHGNLSNEQRAMPLAHEIVAHDKDVAILSHAFGKEGLDDGVADIFRNEGYTMHPVPYEESGTRSEYTHGERDSLLVISRMALVGAHVARLGVRNGLVYRVHDPDTNVAVRSVAYHADDRNAANRDESARAVVSYLSSEEPAFLCTDLNDMHPDLFVSRLVSSRFLGQTAPFVPFAGHRRILQRLHEMGTGTSLGIYNAAGLHDADMSRQPTMPAILPLFQLDHLLTTDDIRVSDFTVEPRSHNSDHRAISAVLHT
ncbi:MAG TPA: endonuclease/exonuclease/phosphatase family protein [Candidatus Saccharimonadales bacterium]|nr:endonuclease/exonuclease/phosphatase family protein [Candidatus Saccharimonadales bacterium]